MSSTRPKLGVCVLTYNSAEKIPTCFPALADAAESVSATVVCVDNASRDGSAGLVEEQFPWVTVVRNATNAGFSAGNNVGAAELLRAGCDWLAFVNPDVRVRPDTFTEMIAVLQASPAAGCIGAQAERQRASARAFRRRPDWLDLAIVYGTARYMPLVKLLVAPFYKWRFRRHYVPPAEVASGQEVYAVAGDCIVFSAAAFRAAGGFDERSFLYAEEFMMSERLRGAGYTVVAAPRARYDTEGGASSSGVAAAFLRRHAARSLSVYAAVYRGWKFRARLLDALFGCEAACWSAIDRLRGRA